MARVCGDEPALGAMEASQAAEEAQTTFKDDWCDESGGCSSSVHWRRGGRVWVPGGGWWRRPVGWQPASR